MKKYNRQSLILDLIENNVVETQEQLNDLLENKGVHTTQATISRDIKELKIFKAQDENGRYRYTIIDQVHDSLNERLQKVYNSSVLSVKQNGELIIVKTISYTATVCGWYITNEKIDGVAGIITGHDTIFIAIIEGYDIQDVMKDIKDLMN